MKQNLKAANRRLFKRGQAGQSIVILAFAFVMLLAFVGIVTDISVLFVRFSTLQRAVDSAAVAAATQMRRVLDEDPTAEIDLGGSTSYANMSLAARSFIELYGLNPDEVVVETCRVQLIPHDSDGNPQFVEIPGWFEREPGESLADFEARMDERYRELCTPDQRKLVRVTAKINTPTFFLRVLGMQDFDMIAESISETAVLDVMMILDVSESMASETEPGTYETILTEERDRAVNERGYTTAERDAAFDDPARWETRYLPGRVPTLSYGNSPTWAWWQGAGGNLPNAPIPGFGLAEMTQNQIDNYLADGTTPFYADLTEFEFDSRTGSIGSPFTDRYFLKAIPFTVGQTMPAVGSLQNTWDNLGNPFDPTDNSQPRYECRVRFWPFAHRSEPIQDAALQEYIDFLGSDSNRYDYFNIPPDLEDEFDWDDIGDTDEDLRNQFLTYRGFTPAYNFFGCCNDPNGDGSFEDLVCEPFYTARDATLNFLDRIDFLRGDRVGFVTFDRSAYLFDVNGPGEAFGFMIDNQSQAEAILRNSIGVRAEANFYYEEADNTVESPLNDQLDGDGNVLVPIWDAFRIGNQDVSGTPADPTDDVPRITDLSYPRDATLNYFADGGSRPVGAMDTFPVFNNCPFDMASLRYPYVTVDPADYDPPTDFPGLLAPIAQPVWNRNNGDETMLASYDRRGSCAGTNIGSALRVANQALGQPTEEGGGRREGAVWIMVLLSDGAAGASDPIADNGVLPKVTLPYADVSDSEREGTYGAFGVCPYGQPGGGEAELLDDAVFPYCSDEQPETRTFCHPGNEDPPNNPNLLDLNNTFLCGEFYDVDDYARDWADFVGGVTATNSSNAQLPTIFTIGFGLNFPASEGCDTDPTRCTEEYLGEELLRYVADAGDNNRIDNDYWQYYIGEQIPEILPRIADPALSDEERAILLGQPGACEEERPLADYAIYSPIAPAQSCGNYFNAADEDALEFVFNEIASRMFTRLSQ